MNETGRRKERKKGRQKERIDERWKEKEKKGIEDRKKACKDRNNRIKKILTTEAD